MKTPASKALAAAGFSRRDFLKTSGAMIVVFAAAADAQGPTAGSPAGNQLDSWIAIAADGSIQPIRARKSWGREFPRFNSS